MGWIPLLATVETASGSACAAVVLPVWALLA